MHRRVPLFAAVLLAAVACGGRGTEDPDTGTPGTDGGHQTTDGGTHEDGGPATDGGHQNTDGGHVDVDGGPPPVDAGTTISLDLFEIKGTVPTGQIFPTTADVQLLAPYVAVTPNDRVHGFDDRHELLGCYADHYDVTTAPPAHDVQDGKITITGYRGATFYLSNTRSPSSMECNVLSGNYSCRYAPFATGDLVAGKPFDKNANPLGSGMITFSNSGTGVLSTFSASSSGSQTLSATTNLTTLNFHAANGVTINYSCSNCSNALVLVTLAASRTAADEVPSATQTSFGTATCAAAAGTSIFIPRGAIDAMLGGDSNLQSVVTSLVVATPPSTPAHDMAGNPINVLVGRGVFGISSL